MSSHREAPGISQGPRRRQHGLLRVREPGQARHRDDHRQLHPAARTPAGGPNFYEFGDDVLYEIDDRQQRRRRADITYQFRFTTKVAQPEDVPLQHRARSRARQTRTGTVASSTPSRASDGTARQRSSARTCPARPCNIGPRSTPELRGAGAAAAIHKLPTGGRSSPASAPKASTSTSARSSTWRDLRPFQNLHLDPDRPRRAGRRTRPRASTSTPSPCRSRRRT